MSSSTHLHFNSHLGAQKPRTIARQKPNPAQKNDTSCPFCNRESLVDILASEGPLVLLKNKYPVLEDTLQLVLIETYDCDEELSIYPKEHLHHVIRFGVEKWLEMENSGEFSSVLFFKNHGPFSGGTIFHPHMQIVGLKNVDYRENIREEHFQGLIIAEEPGVEFNLSTKPRVGFFEFNVVLSDINQIDQMADYIQTAVHYVLNYFDYHCNSYNLFFYKLEEKIIAKIMPRFVTSPIYLGFSIPQVSNRVVEIARDVRERYFTEGTPSPNTPV